MRISEWSSDVCSSDLLRAGRIVEGEERAADGVEQSEAGGGESLITTGLRAGGVVSNGFYDVVEGHGCFSSYFLRLRAEAKGRHPEPVEGCAARQQQSLFLLSITRFSSTRQFRQQVQTSLD